LAGKSSKRKRAGGNAAGHELTIYRGPNNAGWATFSLGKNSFDTISAEREIMYRVDKNPPEDLSRVRGLGPEIARSLYAWEPGWVNFVVWHGEDSRGRNNALNNLMTGQSVTFRYYLSTGGSKETTFSLEGAGPIIAQALNIPAQVDPTVAAAAQAKEESQSAYMKEYRETVMACRNVPRSEAGLCFKRLSDCRERTMFDIEAFRACAK
jgi:hypothetical protein